jgi:hypothetical protein
MESGMSGSARAWAVFFFLIISSRRLSGPHVRQGAGGKRWKWGRLVDCRVFGAGRGSHPKRWQTPCELIQNICLGPTRCDWPEMIYNREPIWLPSCRFLRPVRPGEAGGGMPRFEKVKAAFGHWFRDNFSQQKCGDSNSKNPRKGQPTPWTPLKF